MQRYTVYRHTAPNGKVSIGITSMEPDKRWNNGYGYKRQPYFMNAIRKYGWDNFKHEILFVGLSKEEAERKEIELIAQCHSDEKAHGYNVEHGGNSSGKMSEAAKALGLSQGNVSAVARGVRKHSKGYHFRYV